MRKEYFNIVVKGKLESQEWIDYYKSVLEKWSIIKIKTFNKDIWWQWSWNFWRIGFELNFDINKYKYFSFNLYLLLFALEIYLEWE
jgi:hypothetical protein